MPEGRYTQREVRLGEVFRKSQGIERLLEGLGRVLRLATGSLEALLLHAIKAATPWTTDAGVIAPNAVLVQARVHQLRVTLEASDT